MEENQIRNSEILAVQFSRLRSSLKEDLYEQIIANKFSIDPNFTTAINFSSVKTAYASGLTIIGGGNKAITVINYATGNITATAHGLSTDDEIYINGIAKDSTGEEIEELDRKLQYNEFKVTKIDDNIITLTSNIVNDYLKEPLAFYVLYEIFDRIWVELSDRGIVQLQTERTQYVDKTTRSAYKESLMNIADNLMAIALNYIREQNYENYIGTEENEEEYLARLRNLGTRKRVNTF